MRPRREFRELVADPVEWAISVRERWFEREELRASRAHSPGFMPWPPCPYVTDADWDQRMHDHLGMPWPCPTQAQFRALWPEVLHNLATQVARVGRGSFGVDGWGDGDAAIARTVHCLTTHLQPEEIVETGVGRGITTRFILDALARNDRGHLWSIDLPMVSEPQWASEIGIAVPEDLRKRWTLVRGSSRRRLPRLLARVGPIDMFVHDSKHTMRNLLFELEHAWNTLKPHGALVPDDVDLNCAVHVFQAAHPHTRPLICAAEPLAPDIGRQDDTGVFAVVFKNAAKA